MSIPPRPIIGQLAGDDWETQTRKKLEEVRRQAKFELEIANVDELKEKRYSRLGHKVRSLKGWLATGYLFYN